MKIKYIENFLTQEELDTLLKIYDDVESHIGWETNVIDYWSGRVFDLGNLMDKTSDRKSYGKIIKFVKRMQETMVEFFELDSPIYPDIVSLVKWNVGSFQPPHADNAEPDGSPNYTPWRQYSGLLYLNDEYEGGRTHFTNYPEIEIEPKPGALLLFTADLDHMHGVTEITSGERKTIVSFWSETPLHKGLRLW